MYSVIFSFVTDKLVALVGFPFEFEFWAVSLCGGIKASEPKEKPIFFWQKTVASNKVKPHTKSGARLTSQSPCVLVSTKTRSSGIINYRFRGSGSTAHAFLGLKRKVDVYCVECLCGMLPHGLYLWMFSPKPMHA